MKPLRIALVGNPNSGKTTLFNELTGSNQFVGNWPGVTVEKKEGILKNHENATVIDLPGIYSLSPYSKEEVIARNYLIDESPDVLLNIVDATSPERSLYLTTQLADLGIPMVVALNMLDVVERSQHRIDVDLLESRLGHKVVQISALKGTGMADVADAAVAAAGKHAMPRHVMDGQVEHALAHIEEAVLHDLPEEKQRWYAIKLFERDRAAVRALSISEERFRHIEGDIAAVETALDDDAEAIIANERYLHIARLLDGGYRRPKSNRMTTSDKIDRVVTNRWLALPIFAVVMFIIYYISVSTIGAYATNWANDGLFGDGFHLFGRGSSEYAAAVQQYAGPAAVIDAFEAAAAAQGISPEDARLIEAEAVLYDDLGMVADTFPVDYAMYRDAVSLDEPAPAAFGTWVPGIPVALEGWLERIGTASWLQGLIVDGIVAGVGAVLGFLPQMVVLFFFLALLEACGYMARIAFVMDRIFRKFGLSGKSFIPMLIGTGCSVPGIMAARTIEQERDRRMTIITTSFIPCGAKLPVIALIAGALFGGQAWVAPSAYFIGVAAVIVSGIMLKKTTGFAGDPAPFVMELPVYRLPAAKHILRSVWERGSSFVRKAGTVILLASLVVWFLSSFGIADGRFGMVDMDKSLLAAIGGAIAWIFNPLGWGHWQGAVAMVTGLIAKENVVSTFGVLFGRSDVAENGWQIWVGMRQVFTPLAAYSFLVFNLLCAPCFAAVGAIRREMNSAGWTAFALSYQTALAYAFALMVYQFGSWFGGNGNPAGIAAAFVVFAFIIWMLVRPAKKSDMTLAKELV
ncbi:MAG TPA: ferrous iron transport protein B [Clostridiaceae bacterium]|nr:ferrous iron transport protein B [Clostridiaceae bacterium]